MTSLHAYFYYRDQVAFQRQLAAASATDVNARDWLGRTVLHLACAALDAAATEYVRMLLAHPGISVNLQDVENHWTALHRALYNGNLSAGHRSDTDTALKDVEGYRAFDLYNTTVEDTMPNKYKIPAGLELYTWGANRNASLGHGNTDDRIHPEQVVLRPRNVDGRDADERDAGSRKSETIALKLQHALVRDVQMSRLHTVVVTDESRVNIRACGFASTGRLGPGGGQHTQPSLSPIIQLASDVKITAIAVGQDHTLALTSDGVVLSWGLGRFSQLGYDVPAPHVQSSPRVISGPLRRERNNGQLGYDKNASPVQPIPRVVTKVTKPVISVALNDTAMVCLLSTQDVILLCNDAQSRVMFPSPTRLPLDFLAYRPPQASRTITTAQVFCNESMFSTVSSAGEIFTFNVPTPPAPGERPIPVQPQRVWALRKQWSAVHDAALGSDGSLIICTESGHVFVRSRSGGTKASPFVRVTGLQRAVAVRANDTGGLAALRQPYRPPEIALVGKNFAEDIARLRPYISFTRTENEGMRIEPKLGTLASQATKVVPRFMVGDEEDDGESGFETEALARDVQEILCLWDILAQDRTARRRSGVLGQGIFATSKLAHGADLVLRMQGSTELPVHRVVLSAGCAALARVLGGLGSLHDRESGFSIKLLPAPSPRNGAGPPRALAETPRLAIAGVHPFLVLVLVHYLYTDTLLAIGDPRLTRSTAEAFAHGRLQPAQAVRELQTLSRVLHLDVLTDALRSTVRHELPPLLNAHYRAIFDAPTSASPPDVVLRLADRDVWCHSLVLRARSPFFEAFFADEEWTVDRWEGDGSLSVNLSHLEWRSMQYVLRFMCCGEEAEMFERLDFVESIDQFLDLLFDVMFAANELLLDRFLLICSSIVVQYVTIQNISAIYMEAALLHCERLMDSLHQYIAVNMETLLEARLLDDLPPRLIKQLAGAVRGHQAAKSPFARSQQPVNLVAAVNKHSNWLAMQDIPFPIVRSQPNLQSKSSPRVTRKPSLPTSPGSKPTLLHTPPLLINASEDLFSMDEAFVPPLNLDQSTPAEEFGHTPKAGPWKGKSTPKVDMKAILAEAEELQASGRTQYLSTSSSTLMHKQRSGDRMRLAFSLSKTPDAPQGSSPSSSRVVSTPAWRVTAQSADPSSSPSRAVAKTPPSLSQTLARTPPGISQVPDKTPAAQLSGAPIIQKSKSWSTQSSPNLSTHGAQSRTSLGPVISPSKAKPGQTTTTRHGSGKAWILPPVEPVSQSSSSSGAPISFAEIQQLQSQPNMMSKERRSLREIQTEEAELQAEVEFMKWWTAEEERIRLENEAVAESLAQAQSKRPQHHHHYNKKNKKSSAVLAVTESDGAAGPRAPRGGDRRRNAVHRVPSSDGKGTSRV
ncbi:hypothetical protein B0F90DRAFT_1823827 [Multifurca ochricompacta]|uniref:BTB domain-containing protein n=1 Tax=Multifurca ochricompacta TaxID=376703 RepID=A0AAD4LV86_9AGAM|nr:hypothetical protein B0F90DRAFT_1823827 [Multifurca ochricompacta]